MIFQLIKWEIYLFYSRHFWLWMREYNKTMFFVYILGLVLLIFYLIDFGKENDTNHSCLFFSHRPLVFSADLRNGTAFFG